MKRVFLLLLCCFCIAYGFSQSKNVLPKSIDLLAVRSMPVLDQLFVSQDVFKMELKNHPVFFKDTHFSEYSHVSNQLASMLSSTYKKNMRVELDEMMFSFKNLVGIQKNTYRGL